jgi:protein tyrosine/serine phosphatase
VVIPRTRKRIGEYCVAVVLALVAAASIEEVRCAVSHRDEKLTLQGVGNFGRVNQRFYRGAQPTDDGFAHLRDLGIGTVVRLSLGEEGAAAERATVETLGMKFIALPWSSVHDPRSDQIVAFLSFVKAHPEERIFVHCKAGSDRTGVFVALYRITVDHWTTGRAIDEMKAFHYRYIFLPHLQSYVETFPGRLTSESAFEPLDAAF